VTGPTGPLGMTGAAAGADFLPLAGGTLIGPLVLPVANFPAPAVTSGTAVSIDRASGEMVRLSLTGTVASFAVTGWPASGILARLVLEIINTGAFNITSWPVGTLWSGGVPPTLTPGANKKDIVVLTTFDGGATIYGSIVGQDYR
jgi:hypothetical protein